MANKRQRKKKQAKETVQLLQSVGITDKKRLKALKNKPKEAQKVYKTEKKYARWRHQADLLESLGMKRSSPQRTWSEQKFNEWYAAEKKKREAEQKRLERNRKARERYWKKKEQKEKEKAAGEQKTLLIYWTEKTNTGISRDDIEAYKRSLKYVDNDYLIQGIRESYNSEEGTAIGSYVVLASSNVKQDKYFYANFNDGTFRGYNGYFLVYEGIASLRRYHELLVAILTMMQLMYESQEKIFFWAYLKQELYKVNPETADKLIRDLDI